MIRVTCPACGASFTTRDENAGRRGKCPKCQEPVQVPELPEVPEEDLEEAEEVYEEAPPDPGGVTTAGPAMPPLAIGLAVGAAIAGAVAWALLIISTGYEVGWVAWGIGAGIGVAAMKGGGRGSAFGALAGALALMAILAGKYLGNSALAEEELQTAFTEELYQELCRDAELYVGLGADPAEEAVRSFMLSHGYADARGSLQIPAAEVEGFLLETAPLLQQLHAESTPYEEWRADMVDDAMSGVSPVAVIRVGLGPIDLLFVALGVGTAFMFLSEKGARIARQQHRAELRAGRGRRRSRQR